MFVKIFSFLIISVQLFALTLHDDYYINSRHIKLLDIVPDAKYDVTLFKISKSRYSKKIRSSEVVKELNKHGFKSIEVSSNYIKFTKKSPIDLTLIEDYLNDYYKKKYQTIKIKSIFLAPRSYVKELPKTYTIKMQKKAYLSHKGVLSVTTLTHKKIFFNYRIEATVDIFKLKKRVKKGDKISLFNATLSTISLKKLKDLPLDVTQLNISQSKRNLKKNSILTQKDIETLNLVKKNSFVNVSLNNQNINISFSAKALQSGKLNDIITVQKSDKRRIKVKIIGTNRVELR